MEWILLLVLLVLSFFVGLLHRFSSDPSSFVIGMEPIGLGMTVLRLPYGVFFGSSYSVQSSICHGCFFYRFKGRLLLRFRVLLLHRHAAQPIDLFVSRIDCTS